MVKQLVRHIRGAIRGWKLETTAIWVEEETSRIAEAVDRRIVDPYLQHFRATPRSWTKPETAEDIQLDLFLDEYERQHGVQSGKKD